MYFIWDTRKIKMLSKILNADWNLVFDKIGTIVVDRRFWLTFVFPVVFALGLFPELAARNPELLSDQAVGWAELVVGTVIPFISVLVLNNSWTKRAPSGLNFKETAGEVKIKQEDLLKALSDMFGTSK